MDFAHLLILIVLASLSGTLTGFGTSTIMMPIMIMFYPLTESLIFVTIIHWFNAVARLLYFRSGFDLRLLIGFGLTGILAAILGAKMVFLINEYVLIKTVGAFLLLYSIFLFLSPKFQLKFNWFSVSLGGVGSGLIAGLFGMGGAIRSATLAAFNLPKNIYLANSALLLVLIDSSRLITYLQEGIAVSGLLDLGLPKLITAVLLSFVGVSFGKLIVDKIPQDKFRLAIAFFLFCVGVKLICGA